MRYRSATVTALAGSLIFTAAGLGTVLAQGKGGGDNTPVTLSLLVQDQAGRQSEPAALDLARLASELSDGDITITPTFDGGDVAAAVKAGTADLGMLPSREWDAAGVTSLDALEAPFLIDNDALALAVATSDIATKAMGGLSAVGVTGLAMWPEDLRHLFAFGPSGKVFRTPADIAGSPILVVAGKPGHDLISALGGSIYEEDVASGALTGVRGTDADSGALAGMVTGLWGAGLPRTDVTVAGDEVLFAKYQMLVGNSTALDKLSDTQRQLLDQVVAQMRQGALGRHFTEADLAAATCAAGGTVIAAGPDALAQLTRAAAPVTAALAADPVTGGLMTDIAVLKATTPASPGAGTCSPTAASPGPSAATAQLPPNGTWRVELSRDDFVAGHTDPSYAGTYTWTFVDGAATISGALLDGQHFTCSATLVVVGDAVRFSYPAGGQCDRVVEDVRWTLDDAGLQFTLITAHSEPFALNAAIWGSHPWQRVGDAPFRPVPPPQQVQPRSTTRCRTPRAITRRSHPTASIERRSRPQTCWPMARIRSSRPRIIHS